MIYPVLHNLITLLEIPALDMLLIEIYTQGFCLRDISAVQTLIGHPIAYNYLKSFQTTIKIDVNYENRSLFFKQA